MSHFFRLFSVAVATAILSVSVQAEPPKRGERGPGAKQGQGGKPGQGRPGQGAGRPDPAQMVATMMKKFDADGDQKLDSKELTALLAAMRERGGMRRGGEGQGRPDGARRRPQGAAGKRGAGGGNPGGKRPNRPQPE